MAILIYSTPAEIKAFTKYQDVKDRTDEELTIIAQYTALRINGYVGHTFEAYDGVQKISGNDQQLMTLPGRLEQLRTVTITVAGQSTVYPSNKFTYMNDQIYFLDDTFKAGFMNIAIDGVWGWSLINDEIKFVANMLAEEYCLQRYNLDMDTKLMELAPFQQQTIGAFSYKLRDPLDPALASTGNSSADIILKKYKYGADDGQSKSTHFFIEVI